MSDINHTKMRDRVLSIRNFFRRVGSETPSYFRKLRALMVALGSMGAALTLAISTYPALFDDVPFYEKLASHLIVAGIIGSVMASLVVADNSKAVKP